MLDKVKMVMFMVVTMLMLFAFLSLEVKAGNNGNGGNGNHNGWYNQFNPPVKKVPVRKIAEGNRKSISVLNQRLSESSRAEMNGIAANAAMVEVTPSEAGKTTFSVGLGQYDNYSAIGATVVHRLDVEYPTYLNVGVAGNGHYVLGKVGVSFEF